MSGGIARTKQPLAHGASGENYSEKSSNFLKKEITPSMNNTWANGLCPRVPSIASVSGVTWYVQWSYNSLSLYVIPLHLNNETEMTGGWRKAVCECFSCRVNELLVTTVPGLNVSQDHDQRWRCMKGALLNTARKWAVSYPGNSK